MKDLKISKELIKNVLVEETENLPDDFTFDIIDNYILFADDGEYMFEVNIYEFASKCKEWIINKGYHISTSEDSINNYIYLYKMVKNDLGYEIDKSNGVQFDSKGYINNLFEACEWILKSLNKKI